MPALLTSASSRPKLVPSFAIAAVTAPESETSQCRAIAAPGLASAATAPCSNSPSMSSSATRQPSARNRFATASPMPRAAPGTRAPAHFHPVEEVLTVREGEAEMWLDEARVIVYAGQSLIVPARRMHGFRNSGTTTLHIHAVLASPIFEATMEGATEVVRRWVAWVQVLFGSDPPGGQPRPCAYSGLMPAYAGLGAENFRSPSE